MAQTPHTVSIHRLVARVIMANRWIVSCVFVALCAGTAHGGTLKGQLAGEWKQWDDLTIEARAFRDLGQAPLTSAPVDDTGQFELTIPGDSTTVYLSAWPKTGSPYPLFLSTLPVSINEGAIQEFSMAAPALHRKERQQIGASKHWLVGLLLLLILGVGTWFLRRFFSRKMDDVSRDTPPWIPSLYDEKPDHWAAASIAALVGGLVGLSLFGTTESLDLLEYTYFQEAYGGNNPIDVAISAVVAERAHAPGYSVLLWFMTQISANTPWLRGPAVLAAMGTAWMVHRITLRLTAQRVAAALAAAGAALAPLAIRYGHDVSPYSLTALMTVASTGFLLKALCTDDRRAWLGFTLTSISAFFLHYFSAIFILGQMVAVVWIGYVSNRDSWWAGRLRRAIGWFAVVGIFPLLWAPQVFRGFEISMHDNMVTGTVYAAADGFWPYLSDHLRVLHGLPSSMGWATWPCVLLLALSYRHVLRTHPLLGRVLMIPLLMVIVLIGLTYILQSAVYGGRTYYGFRWLRGYVPAVAIPMALACLDWLRGWRDRQKRPWLVPGVLVLSMVVIAGMEGVRIARATERPAQETLLHQLLTHARSGDGIAVLPAGFYSVQTSHYLHDYGPRVSLHEGTARWDHYTKPKNPILSTNQSNDVVLYGPIRSYGIPIETVARHIDLSRLWVVVFRETAFGRPEFEPQISEQTLASLTKHSFPSPWYRRTEWDFTAMKLVLFERDDSSESLQNRRPDPTNPWLNHNNDCAADICLPLKHPYKLLRFAPKGLDPSGLFEMIQAPENLHLRFPTPVGTNNVSVRIVGAPITAKKTDLSIDKSALQFEDGVWTGSIRLWRNRPSFDIQIIRSHPAAHWSLTMQLSRGPFTTSE